MNFTRHISRRLDAEHRSNLELLGRLETALAHGQHRPDAKPGDFAKLIGNLVYALEQDVTRHFEFEERELFPRLRAAGEDGIANLLAQEHDTIRAVAAELLPLARAVLSGPADKAMFEQFKRTALEMVERQVAHIQKETMGLLPMLEDLLDDETDRALDFNYASS